MDHRDHVELLRPAIPSAAPGARWADLGAGTGAFTLALAELLGPASTIVAIDRDGRALAEAGAIVADRYPGVTIRTVVGDFRRPLDLEGLDGIVMANALHFVGRRDQAAVLAGIVRSLRPGGAFIVVEYDADRGNAWVPHPFSAATWESLAAAAGLVGTEVIGRVPSRFLGAIYSASSRRATALANRS